MIVVGRNDPKRRAATRCVLELAGDHPGRYDHPQVAAIVSGRTGNHDRTNWRYQAPDEWDEPAMRELVAQLLYSGLLRVTEDARLATSLAGFRHFSTLHDVVAPRYHDEFPDLTSEPWELAMDAAGHNVTAHLNDVGPCPACEVDPPPLPRRRGLLVLFDEHDSGPLATDVTYVGDASTPLDMAEAARALLMRAADFIEPHAEFEKSLACLIYHFTTGLADLLAGADTPTVEYVHQVIAQLRREPNTNPNDNHDRS